MDGNKQNSLTYSNKELNFIIKFALKIPHSYISVSQTVNELWLYQLFLELFGVLQRGASIIL